MKRHILVCAIALMELLLGGASAWADWPTARGSPQRTGNADGLPGPKRPQVVWVYKSPDHYVAPPVVAAKRLYLAAVGPFNTGTFSCLAAGPGASERVPWSKASPYVQRPTVCAPAVVDGLVVFGDGMHQTNDALLYCLKAETGLPLWQLAVPGQLVHLESAPTIDRGRVYIGAGEAGLLCVDLKRVTLDGREQDVAEVLPQIEQRWAELHAKYEEEKKKDPALAIPPSEDALPKPVPKLRWQKGQKTWHVDAPVAVSGDRLLAASAYVEEDKVGKRCLVCLRADDGGLLWETPLEVNPWAGPTVAGNTVLVGCSSIRFDRKLIKQARGQIVAVELGNGQVRWKQDSGGGVLSAIAVQGGTAVSTGTDGKVTARRCDSGEPLWSYDAGVPFFAGPAIAGEVVYAADLKGVLHALALADGKPLWKLDVAKAPDVQSPGMFFAAPTVHEGRIYLATCNLDADAPDQTCVVLALSDETPESRQQTAPPLVVDRQQREVVVATRIAPRKLPTLKDVYPIEVIATYPTPRGQKAHETIVTFLSKPSEVHKALESLGLKAGKPARGEGAVATGAEVRVYLELPGLSGTPRRIPIEKTLLDMRTGKPLPLLSWHFTGSALRQPDPEKEERVYAADLSGTLISLFPVTDETVVQSNLTMSEESLLKLETNKNLLPEQDTPVKLIIQAK